MPIASTLTWESEIADGASKDARALRRLQKALASTGEAVTSFKTSETAQALGQLGNASALAAVQVEQLRGQHAREAAAAKNAAQQNAALAKLIIQQAKAKGEAAKEAAKQTAKAEEEQTKATDREAEKRRRIAEREAKRAQQIQAERRRNMLDTSDAPGGPGAGDLLARLGGKPGAVASQLAEQLGASTQSASLLGSVAGIAIQAAVKIGTAVYDAYQKAIAIITSLTTTGVGLVISATSAHESVVGSLEALGRTHEASESLYRKVVAMSIATGRDKGAIAAEFKRLASVGFKDEQLPVIAKMLADVSAVKGEGKANQMEKLFTKIQAKDALDPRVVTALTNQGFSQKELYKTLAKALKRSESDIPGLIKAGKINAATAEAAIAKIVEKQLGPATEKQANTILALIGRIKIAAEELFDLGDNEKATAPLKKFLKGILAMLAGPEGAKLKLAVGNLFAAIFGTAFDDLNSKAGQATIANAFRAITDGVNMAAAAVRTLRPEVQALLAMIRQMSKDGSLKALVEAGRMTVKAKLGGMQDDAGAMRWKAKAAASPGRKMADAWTDPLGELDEATGAGVKRRLGVSTLNPFKALQRMLAEQAQPMFDDSAEGKGGKLPKPGGAANTNGFALPQFATDDATADMSEQGSLIGMALNQGMSEGIEATAAEAIAAAGGTAEQIIAVVRAILKTHSPSEEFDDIAKDTVAGMSGGFDKHGGKAAEAAGRMAGGVVKFGKAGAKGAGGGADGGGINVVINIVAGPKASADDIARIVEERVVEVLRKQSEAA